MSHPIDTESYILQYLAQHAHKTTSNISLTSVLGEDTSKWRILQELSGGNMNFTFCVQGTTDTKIIVKYSAPYVKILKDWTLNQKRSGFEIDHLLLANKYTAENVPTIYHYDKAEAIIVMQYMENAVTLREALMRRWHESSSEQPPQLNLDKVAEHISDYIANVLFHTSDLFLPIKEKMPQVVKFSENYELIQITDQVIFTEPYQPDCKNNYWDDAIEQDVRAIQNDVPLKKLVYKLKDKFRNSPQALLHGDLHTGSILVDSKQNTWVIDPEFCFFGPMGFDLGLYIGNSYITYLCLKEQGLNGEPVLELIKNTWNSFVGKLKALFHRNRASGDLYNIDLNMDPMAEYLEQLFIDSIGYAGCAMIRRIIGVAACLDARMIEDAKVRNAVERNVMLMGRKLVMNIASKQLTTIDEVNEQARNA